MFIYNEKLRNYWFSGESKDYIEFELIGIILGLAIYNSVILDIHFPFFVYKKLRFPNEKGTLEDLQDIDPALAKGLKSLLNYEGDDVEEMFGATFQISYEDKVYGNRTQDLKEGGDMIPVTHLNKTEYVDLYVEFLLEKNISKQFANFAKGFNTVCMSSGFCLFRAEELELLICGSPLLDFEELEKVTRYEGYLKTHPVVQQFWEIVHGLTMEQKKKLLFFATGSDRAPIGGLGKMYFVIARNGPNSDRLPTAHTCFNHLLIPEYDSKDKLYKCLLSAIDNAEGFGML